MKRELGSAKVFGPPKRIMRCEGKHRGSMASQYSRQTGAGKQGHDKIEGIGRLRLVSEDDN